MNMLSQLSIEYVYQFLLVFCRVGAAIMLLPALSESYISARSRLIIALIFSLLLVSIAGALLPPLPKAVLSLTILVGKEIIVGIFIGSVAKLLMSAMHTAGMVIAYQSGLASASLFDPSQGGQSSVFGIFLMFLSTLIIFATNLHHLFLQGIIDSYQLFSPATILPSQGFMHVMTETISRAFLVGFKIASPHIVVGLVVYLGAGVMGRLMPQMQVFFILLPIQITIGFFILMITLATAMIWFTDYYMEIIGSLIYFEPNE